MKILNLKSKILNHKNGFIFLEVLISTALISIVFITFLSIGVLSLNVSYDLHKKNQMDSLVKEELEALRSFRDDTTWATNGLGTVLTSDSNPYHLVLDTTVSPAKWKLVTGLETADSFTRKVVFDKVSRDLSTNNIESTYNSSRDDPDTRKVTVSVTFKDKTSQVITYLTNWQK